MMWLLAIVVGLLTLSPIATDAIGAPRAALWALGCALLVAAAFSSTLKPRRPVLFGLVLALLLLLALVSVGLFGLPRAATIPLIPLLPLMLLLQCPLRAQKQVVRKLSDLHIVLLIGCWLGLAYYLLGWPPIFSFVQYDGRTSEWYLATLSVTVEQGFMRASSVYDEPGALSLIVTAIACLRILFKQAHGKTLWLMVLGLVTGSVAHIACLILIGLHIAIDGRIWRRIHPGRAMAALVIALPLLVVSYETLLAPRLVETASGQGLEADTRTPLVLRSLLLLEQASVTTGLQNGMCYFDPVGCVDEFGIFLESPLGPFLALGLPGSLVYYLFVAVTLALALLQPRLALVHLTMLALFLQRPYVMNVGYCLLVGMYLAAVVGMRVQRRSTRQRRIIRPNASPTPT